MPMTDIRKTTGAVILATAVALALTAGTATAQNTLKPGPNYNAAQIRQADQLYTDYRAGRLGAEGTQYWAAYQRAQAAARSAVGKLVAGNSSQSCHCTATCQTVLVVNGGSIYFEGEGTVSSPSACADAAEAFCGSAVSSFLTHWNCK